LTDVANRRDLDVGTRARQKTTFICTYVHRYRALRRRGTKIADVTRMNTTATTFPLWSSAPDVSAIDTCDDVESHAAPRVSSDFELAQAAGRGEMAAFEELYQRHNRRVFSLCVRMLQNTSEAEDLAQEVFIQLFRKIGSFRGESAFTTWLHRMTVNQVLMHFRKRSVKLEKTTEEGETPVQIVTGTSDPLHMPVVDRIAIDKAVAQLPNGYRSVFILHDVEGHEHEEVARILGCSVGTSKSQLHKARMKLRRLLKKQSPPRMYPVSVS
jgi:RNA polymerase sigma-70 factor, ECF subfamily